MPDYIGVVTNLGAQKIAAAIGGAAVNLTTVRVGDGNGAAIVPAPNMIDLVRRVGNDYPIIASGRDAINNNMWRISAVIPAADGPFDIREIAVFDAAGTMIAIASHVLVEKRAPAQGVVVEVTTDILFPVASTAQVAVTISPSVSVSIAQILRAGFQSVESASLAAPPANPAIGATYVIAANAINAWAGLTGRLTQWTGSLWAAVSVPPGFVVVAQDKALDDPARWLRRVDGGWVNAGAGETAFGVTLLATKAETAARAINSKAVHPRALTSLIGAGNDFRTVINATTAAPPANPVTGDAYLIAANAAGAWAGHSGKIATFDGEEWIIEQLRLGARAIDRSALVTSPNRELRQTAALIWTPVEATVTNFGHARRASDAEAQTGAAVSAFITPDQVVGLGQLPIGALPFPEVFSVDKQASIVVIASAGNGGTVTVTGGELVQLGEATGGGLGRMRRFTLPAAAFAALAVNSTYYVRARVTAGALEVYQQGGADTDAEPGGSVGTPGNAAGGGFDSTRLDILLARIVTGAAGSAPVLTRYRNAQVLSISMGRSTPVLGSITGANTIWSSNGESVFVSGAGTVTWTLLVPLGWARKPAALAASGYYWVGGASLTQYVSGGANNVAVTAITRDLVTLAGNTDYDEQNVWLNGATLRWTSHQGQSYVAGSV